MAAMAIAIIARIPVLEGKGAEFEAVFQKVADGVKAHEPGVLLYQLTKKSDTEYVVVELYADQEALAKHGQMAHSKEGGKATRGLVGGPPKIEQLKVVGTSGGSKL